MNSELLIYLFLGWSISSTLVNGSIFDSIRNWCLVYYPMLGKLLSCVRCSSFWVGLGLFSVMITFASFSLLPDKLPVWSNYILMPFIQSGFSVVVESFVIFLVKESVRTREN